MLMVTMSINQAVARTLYPDMFQCSVITYLLLLHTPECLLVLHGGGLIRFDTHGFAPGALAGRDRPLRTVETRTA